MLSPNFAAQEAIVFLFAKRALRRASVHSVPAQRADAFFLSQSAPCGAPAEKNTEQEISRVLSSATIF
jgi:hypothetical protein